MAHKMSHISSMGVIFPGGNGRNSIMFYSSTQYVHISGNIGANQNTNLNAIDTYGFQGELDWPLCRLGSSKLANVQSPTQILAPNATHISLNVFSTETQWQHSGHDK